MSVDEGDIVEHAGETFAERGEAYFEDGRVVSARIEGDRLTAECYGSREKPYRVEARLDGGSVVASDCTCPVRGPCKHVAALLYAYLRDRSSFADSGALRERVRAMSRERLADVLMEVAERHREVERFLERRLLETSEADGVDADEIRRHAERAFASGFQRAAGHGFGEVVAEIVDDLEKLAAIGTRHRDAGRYAAALSVWKPLVEVAADHDFRAGRGLDDLFDFLGHLEEEIGGLLEGLEASGARRAAFDALWKLFLLDLDHGGVGLARTVWRAVREAATEAERRELVERAETRRRRARDSGWPDERTGRLLIRFLEEFGEGSFDLESQLEDYEQLGAESDLVRTLADAGREEDAVDRVRSIEASREVVGALDQLVGEGLEDRAEAVARERLEERGHDHAVQAWLIDFLVDRDRGDDALEVAITMLEQHPNRESLERVELLAGGLGEWERVREDALEMLREDAPRAFLQYTLDREEVDETAVEVWEREFAPRSHETWRARDLELELADRLAERRPDVSVRIWREEIASLLEAGGPDGARRAAELLDRIRSALEESGEDEQWRSIREQFVTGAEAGTHWSEALEEAGLRS